MHTNKFDRISFWSLFLTIVLLPFFFLPFTNIPIEIAKGALVVFGLVISIIFWTMARFRDGKVVLPRSSVLLAGLGMTVVLFFSAIFSQSSNVSMFGTMLGVGSFYFMLVAYLLMFFSAMAFNDLKKVNMLLLGIMLSSAVVLIFQSINFFSPKFLGMGVLVAKTDNILGSWYALGFFAGLSSLVSLFIIEFFSIPRVVKWVLSVLLFLGLAVVALVSSSNFPMIWILTGVFALVIFTYKASTSFEEHPTEGRKMHFPMLSFVVVMISLLFLMSGPVLGGFLSSHYKIENNEARPSFMATMDVTKSVLKAHPVLGIGPNRFDEAWALYKSKDVNTSAFWDVAFGSGYGFFPTLASTTGSLGILSLILFLVLFLLTGVRFVFFSMKKGVNHTAVAFFLIALYLFIASFVYLTGIVLILLAFVFTGAFIGFSANNHKDGEMSVAFLDDNRKSFFFILFFILIMIGSIVISFKYGERFVSAVYFQKAVNIPLDAETLDVALADVGKSIVLYPNDVYMKTYSQIYLLKFNSLASKDGSTLTEAEKADLKTSVEKAVEQAVRGAQLATEYNPKNYLNFQALGSLYQSLASVGVKDANTQAIEAYKSATLLNPSNPKIKLILASLFFNDGKKEEAKAFTKEALVLKPDYADAYRVLSEISKDAGNNTEALSYAETALSLNPTDKNLIDYLNSLKKTSTASVTDNKDATPAPVKTP